MNLLAEIKDEFSDYFRGLGYTVTWDRDRHTGTEYYELVLSGVLVCQVDLETPLSDFLDDLPFLIVGQAGPSKSNYSIAFKDTGAMKALLDKVLAGRHITKEQS